MKQKLKLQKHSSNRLNIKIHGLRSIIRRVTSSVHNSFNRTPRCTSSTTTYVLPAGTGNEELQLKMHGKMKILAEVRAYEYLQNRGSEHGNSAAMTGDQQARPATTNCRAPSPMQRSTDTTAMQQMISDWDICYPPLIR
ncbi:Hypothetical protein, putative [Bodo saltans]|uniref:Uncharacterized protein n=1 Tax=Bodo saltans TaxID=75058 RepID=A0A0S4JAC7_BODSA|nr:Hypothetical protein, putative [Bodo saltans]|eukprot:CUG85887.1 Hypothetical protein, putative [Bodo saltans]